MIKTLQLKWGLSGPCHLGNQHSTFPCLQMENKKRKQDNTSHRIHEETWWKVFSLGIPPPPSHIAFSIIIAFGFMLIFIRA